MELTEKYTARLLSISKMVVDKSNPAAVQTLLQANSPVTISSKVASDIQERDPEPDLVSINEIFLPCHMHQNVRPVCHPHLSSTTAGTAVGSSTMPGTLHQTMASTPHLRLILTPMVAGRSPGGGPEGRVPTQFWADQLTLSQPAGAH
jgi:hypothetical protein